MSERIPTLWKKNPKVLEAGGYPLYKDHLGGVAGIRNDKCNFLVDYEDPDDPSNLIIVYEGAPRYRWEEPRRDGELYDPTGLTNVSDLRPPGNLMGDSRRDRRRLVTFGYSYPADSQKHKTVSSWDKPDAFVEIAKLKRYIDMADLIEWEQLTIDYFGLAATPFFKAHPLSHEKVFFANEHADTSEIHMKKWKPGVWALSWFGQVDATILNNEDLKQRYVRIYGREMERIGSRVEMIPNPIVLDGYGPECPKRENWAGQVLDKNTLVLFSIGRLEERKGFKHLLHTIKAVLDDPEVPKNFKLVIAGSGPQEEELKALATSLGINDHIIFLGRISEEDKRKAFNSAEIVCLFSDDNESQGGTIAEGQAAGAAALVGKAFKESSLTQVENSVVQLETTEVKESKEKLKRLMMDAMWRKLIQNTGLESVKQFGISVIMGKRFKLANEIHYEKMRDHKRNRFSVYMNGAYGALVTGVAYATSSFFEPTQLVITSHEDLKQQYAASYLSRHPEIAKLVLP
ncbi:MAG TPA: glycosyltransferase [Candidatus Saccharimonadales bacterium]|nr:glycosyltransferase [Candidatus Saccharimonadales bacterium]